MGRIRARRILTHWRTWWDLASITFVTWLSIILVGAPRPSLLESFYSFGLPISIGLFFVGFVCLVRRQRTDERRSNSDQ